MESLLIITICKTMGCLESSKEKLDANEKKTDNRESREVKNEDLPDFLPINSVPMDQFLVSNDEAL